MQVAMEKHVGIYRDENTLKESCGEVGQLKQRLDNGIVEDKDHVYNTELVAALELDFMLDVAETIPYSALKRRESRGPTTGPTIRNGTMLTFSRTLWHTRPRGLQGSITVPSR